MSRSMHSSTACNSRKSVWGNLVIFQLPILITSLNANSLKLCISQSKDKAICKCRFHRFLWEWFKWHFTRYLTSLEKLWRGLYHLLIIDARWKQIWLTFVSYIFQIEFVIIHITYYFRWSKSWEMLSLSLKIYSRLYFLVPSGNTIFWAL